MDVWNGFKVDVFNIKGMFSFHHCFPSSKHYSYDTCIYHCVEAFVNRLLCRYNAHVLNHLIQATLKKSFKYMSDIYETHS